MGRFKASRRLPHLSLSDSATWAIKIFQSETTHRHYAKVSRATAIDLSAIAKGYAVDQLAELLDNAGVDAWLIEVGGELRTRGSKTSGQPWQVGIEKPIANERSAQRVISLRNAAIATSGDYRNFFEF